MDMTDLSMVPTRRRSPRRNRTVVTFLDIENVAEYLRVNPKVLGGYRQEMSWYHALQTIFMWHNETLNIWSHLIGTLCFVCLLLITVANQQRFTPQWPLLIFDLAAVYTLSISTLFHTCLCISKSHFQFWRKLDFTGILVVMFGMYWPFCYYSFGCIGSDGRNWFVLYVSVAGALATLCLGVVLLPVFQSNRFHVFRPLIFAIMIIWGFTPVLHIAAVDWEVNAIRNAVVLTMSMFALVIVGGLLYMTRWPESVFHANKLSAYGFHSHFLFHVCVVIGLVTFHVGNVVLYKWRESQGGCSISTSFVQANPV